MLKEGEAGLIAKRKAIVETTMNKIEKEWALIRGKLIEIVNTWCGECQKAER